MAGAKRRWGIGNLIAPPRFIVFALVTAVAIYAARPMLGWRYGIMAGVRRRRAGLLPDLPAAAQAQGRAHAHRRLPQ